MANRGGRPRNDERDQVAEMMGLSVSERKHLHADLARQVLRCNDDAARKVLLGIREPERLERMVK